MTEANMVLDCYNKLKKHGKYREIVLEVPYLSRCIDMVLVSENNELISIEFKLKDWRRALKQAQDHKLGTDKSYICIPKPEKGIPVQLKKELKINGIGLLIYDHSKETPFEEVIRPKVFREKWEPWVISLKSRINELAAREVFSF